MTGCSAAVVVATASGPSSSLRARQLVGQQRQQRALGGTMHDGTPARRPIGGPGALETGSAAARHHQHTSLCLQAGAEHRAVPPRRRQRRAALVPGAALQDADMAASQQDDLVPGKGHRISGRRRGSRRRRAAATAVCFVRGRAAGQPVRQPHRVHASHVWGLQCAVTRAVRISTPPGVCKHPHRGGGACRAPGRQRRQAPALQ